jgi:8-oxo-dGTP pyrophosphatase MutT (NUDIX family)
MMDVGGGAAETAEREVFEETGLIARVVRHAGSANMLHHGPSVSE